MYINIVLFDYSGLGSREMNEQSLLHIASSRIARVTEQRNPVSNKLKNTDWSDYQYHLAAQNSNSTTK